MRPRRSALFMPGINERAMEKARSLRCDVIIFDLEDAVAPDSKIHARGLVREVIERGGYGNRELVVRCNGIETPWCHDDVETMVTTDVDGLLFPKVERAEQVYEIRRRLDALDGPKKNVWVMIETPRGVTNVEKIAESPADVLVMGTSDLVADLRAQHTDNRDSVLYALSRCVNAARSEQRDILDGVHLDLENNNSLEKVCEQGRSLGFDGKCLIHPSQIATANRIFGVDEDALLRAKQITEIWAEALSAGKGVAVMNGQLIEKLHYEEACRLIAYSELIEDV
ncbi:MAG TPA: CoA ester lyase [Gammaproteobacteria bacterium]|nr:CoA ester lyase [Gammaproteobacteria bacterium]